MTLAARDSARPGQRTSVNHRLSAASRCTRCLTRWRQSKLGLCRRCEKELGIEAEGNLERDRLRLERQREKVVKVDSSRAFAAVVARTPRLLALNAGVVTCAKRDLDYIVVLDGSFDGAMAMGLPLAKDRGVLDKYTRGRNWFPTERKGARLRHPGAFEIT